MLGMSTDRASHHSEQSRLLSVGLMGRFLTPSTIRTRRGTEEEHRLGAVAVIVMRAAVMTETIAEETTGAVGQVDRQADPQADLVAQMVAADRVVAVGRETHRALI